jgi:hypothetical protein
MKQWLLKSIMSTKSPMAKSLKYISAFTFHSFGPSGFGYHVLKSYDMQGILNREIAMGLIR